MRENEKVSDVNRLFVAGACFVVIVTGMRMASSLLVPFLLALFIAILCAPPLFWMQKKGVPAPLAVLSILVGIVFLILIIAVFVGSSVSDFSSHVHVYQARLTEMTGSFLSWLKGMGLQIPEETIKTYLNPGKIMRLAANALSGLSGLFTNVFLILLTVIFILLEASGFSVKLGMALKEPEKSLVPLRQFSESVSRYIGLKTLFSILTGVAIGIWLAILGIDYAVVWGLVAFLLNYVPNIGSIIAAIPAVLLALVQLGTGSALLAALGYVVVNIAVGSIIEPRSMGKGLGLSTLVVFVSLIFWGWVLGPVGMVLSVPLTMIVKIGLESNENTRWIAILLGSHPVVAHLKSPKKASKV
jgi:predicted PurR-regulated permease PerM